MSHLRLADRLRLILAAVLFSTGGAAIKATTLDAWQVASARSAIAAVTVWLLVRAARRRWNWRIVVVGAIYAATMILFVLANKLTTSANAIFIQSTSPLWILLAGPLVLHERATRRDVAFMVLIAIGMSLFFIGNDAPQRTAPNPARGNLLALVSSVAWAGTVLGLRWLGRPQLSLAVTADEACTEAPTARTDDAITTVVAGNVIACLVCLPMAWPFGAVHAPDVAVMLYLGIFQIGIAYLSLSVAMPHVPAIEASTLLLVEPALNPVWAWLVHDERPSPLAWTGGAIILLGAAGKTWLDTRAARPAVPTVRSPAR